MRTGSKPEVMIPFGGDTSKVQGLTLVGRTEQGEEGGRPLMGNEALFIF